MKKTKGEGISSELQRQIDEIKRQRKEDFKRLGIDGLLRRQSLRWKKAFSEGKVYLYDGKNETKADSSVSDNGRSE